MEDFMLESWFEVFKKGVTSSKYNILEHFRTDFSISFHDRLEAAVVDSRLVKAQFLFRVEDGFGDRVSFTREADNRFIGEEIGLRRSFLGFVFGVRLHETKLFFYL